MSTPIPRVPAGMKTGGRFTRRDQPEPNIGLGVDAAVTEAYETTNLGRIKELLGDDNELVRATAAANPVRDTDTRAMIAADPSWFVRLGGASTADAELAASMADESDVVVCSTLVLSGAGSYEQVARWGSDVRVREAVAQLSGLAA